MDNSTRIALFCAGYEPCRGVAVRVVKKGVWGVFNRAFLCRFFPRAERKESVTRGLTNTAFCAMLPLIEVRAMKRYKYLLFDLDGTLMQSHPGIFAGIRHALKEMGRAEEPTDEYLRRCIGPSLVYSFSNFFHMSEEDAERATAIYRAWYGREGVFLGAPIEGALQALKTLKDAGYVLALATSKPQVFADKVTERFGFSKFLTVRVGCGLDGSFPTKASVIGEAMRRLGASADECLMIGDRKHDAEGAKEQGVDCALLAVGYGDKEEFAQAKPKYAFESFEELTAFLTTEN